VNFNRIGPWEKWLEAVFWNFLRSPYNRRFAQELGLRRNQRVLEFGSGSGAVSRHLAPLLSRGGQLVCVDTSRGLMEIARRRLASFSNVELLEGVLRRKRIKSRTFDAIVVHFVLHDIPAPERKPLAREWARLLKPRGLLFLREPTRQGHGMAPGEIRSVLSNRFEEKSSFLGRRLGGGTFFSAVYRKRNR